MIPSIYNARVRVVKHQAFAAKQFIITLKAPEIAKQVIPGQFVHIRCSDAYMMPRPISIMSVNQTEQTIDLLYKVVGSGTEILSKLLVEETIHIIGPIGNGFTLGHKKKLLLLGGGVGMPPMITLAQSVKDNPSYQAQVILASEAPFPFELVDNHQNLIHPNSYKTMPLLKDWGIDCALSSLQKFEGVYIGYITDLAQIYLDNLSEAQQSDVMVYACGPTAMLEAVKILVDRYQIPAQLSLEEYMACAVGGCAGCVVEVKKDKQITMERVCVDGPVFNAEHVFN